MHIQIGSRYLKGFNVAEMNSVDDFGDDPKDSLIKRLFVRADKNELAEWELVAWVDVETINIQQDGVDYGGHNSSVEVYRLPFPSHAKLRKAIIRSFIAAPKFFMN